MTNTKEARVKANQEYMKSVISSVLYLERNELSFRGHRKSGINDKGIASDKGNYLELLDLYDHEPSSKNSI